MHPETTLTRYPVMPDQGGPRSARCIRKPPLPGAPQSRIKAEHGVRDAPGNHPYPVYRRAGTGKTTNSEMLPHTTLTRHPAGADQGRPWIAICYRKHPYPVPRRGGSRRTTECKMNAETTSTRCPVEPDQ